MLGETDMEDSVDLCHWTFRDGTSVHAELRDVEISKIRAVCNQQSRTKWTTIASRQRLYQFISLSDEETQEEMRLKALSLMDLDSVPCIQQFGLPSARPPNSSTVGLSDNPFTLNEENDTSPASTSNIRRTKRKRSVDDTLSFFDGQNIHEVFHQYSIANLKATCQQFISGLWPRTRTEIYLLISQAATPIQAQIRTMVMDAMQSGGRMYSRRARPANHDDCNVRRMGERPGQDESLNGDIVEKLCQNQFMKVPSKEVVNAAVAEFIDRTGNVALATGICAVCARETGSMELLLHRIDSFPNPHRLEPMGTHSSHDLFNRMLLHPPGVENDGTAHICVECLRALKSNKVPMFALANGLWIGQIPHELAYLTLPEQILIAKYFPAAYIIKLYPKKAGARHWDKRQMYSGLRGNVSTYRLDQSQITSMVDGSIMPQAAKVLAATIGITFVGPKNLPERSLPNMFRVRRQRVKMALEWLKANNPLFKDITISASRLAQLPEDDIPYELLATAKLSTDVNTLYAEQDGYIPSQDTNEDEHDEDNGGMESEPSEDSDNDDEGLPTEPAVLALSHLGVVDIDGVEVTESELMAHALANCSQARQEEDYMIRRGSAFVNEYARVDPLTGQRNDGGPSDANHLLGCFPTLFPYGQGGFEIERPVNMPYEAHVQWAMQYEDRRFRKDPHFPFQVFGVCQKRQVCRASILQMKKGSYFRFQNVLSTITAGDLTKASQEETRGVPFSNPAVRILRSQLSAVKTKVQGSDESRNSIRSKIWGTNLLHNPPSLWVTINPSDTQDPIAQVLAGADINLDAFCKTAGPDSIDRAVNMASDPYASAKFFHLMINTILEVLIGFSKRWNGIIVRREGIFGVVKSYVGTVEAQGRGSLHLHLLLWLAGAPTAKELNDALTNDVFREKIKRYIRETIRADLDMKDAAEVAAMAKVDAASYSRPLDPRKPADVSAMKLTESGLARTTQFHKCSYTNCLKIVKGRAVCKRRAPFPLAHDDWVDSMGAWGPKRLCGFLNNWNPPLLMTVRANHDVKLIMSGKETSVLTWYITNYASKKQQRSSNVSALLAKRVAFHMVEERRRRDLTDVNKRLIQRCANTLTRDREFSGPEIMSYLMGWGDRFESHHYVAIFSDVIISALKERFPGLRKPNHSESLLEERGTSDASNNNRTHIITMESGVITLKDQLHEYMYRGEEIIEMSMLTFILNTYDAKGEQGDDGLGDQQGGVEPGTSTMGRRPNRRVPYRQGFGKVGRSRVFRTEGHETLPHIVGSWFPRNDRPRERELYCASMLVLLMPWSDLSDLKADTETFDQRFNCFIAGATKKTHDILENIQYYYECYDGAKSRREEQAEGMERTIDFEDEMSTQDVTNSLILQPEVIERHDERASICTGRNEHRSRLRNLL
ncbi:hypothetical protein BYT27DRAFT_7214734 [Phlegmacium glaucopus]|nr:hypothetical protein BYT27DRAFT_7214734 [Phlegmacium glaucopus]